MPRPQIYILCLAFRLSPGQPHPPPESSGVSALVRETAPGGMFANFYHEISNKPFNTTHSASGFRGPVITRPDGLKEQTFLSSPMTVASGEVINNYTPLNWPDSHIALKGYTGDIVKLAPGADPNVLKEDGFPEVVKATRKEVYLHHWIVSKWQMPRGAFENLTREGGRDFDQNDWRLATWDAGMNSNANGPCGPAELHFFFGAGNEIRGPPSGANESFMIPDPYALESNPQTMAKEGMVYTLNTQINDIRNVADRRGCTECECNVTGAKRVPPNYTGGLVCCHSTHYDGGRCPLVPGAESTQQTYYVKYKLLWRDIDDPYYAKEPMRHAEVMTLEVADNGDQWYDPVPLPGSFHEGHDALKNDPVSMASLRTGHSGINAIPGGHSCHVEYWVPPCAAGGACTHRFHNSWQLPFAADIISIHSHYHVGGTNLTTSVNGVPVCTGHPTYDADGFLSEISSCDVGREEAVPLPFVLKAGDRIDVESVYKQDQRPHFGVMGFSVIFLHRRDYPNVKASAPSGDVMV